MKIHYVKNRETDYAVCGKELTSSTYTTTGIELVNCKKCKRTNK